MSTKLLQRSQRQRSLTNPAAVLVLTILEKEDKVLEMTNAAALRNSTEEANPGAEKLSAAMNTIRCMYGNDFLDLEELCEADVGEKLSE